jgi:hypothetical protein
MGIIAFQDGIMLYEARVSFPRRGLSRFSAGPKEALNSTFTFGQDCVCLHLAFINGYILKDICAAGG